MRDRSNWLSSVFRNPLSGLEPSWRQALQTPAVSALIALLVAQLVAALVLAGNAMLPDADDAPLLDLSTEQVARIELSGPEGQVIMARADGGWVLPALAGFPADADKVEQLLSRLTTLERPLPVGSSSEAQRRLKVSDDNAERRIRLSNDAGELAQILIGDSPGFRRLYARLAGEEAVYDLPLASFQIATENDDWLRQDQLRLDAAAIERVSSDRWTLNRIDTGWQLTITQDRSAGAPSPTQGSALDPAALDQAEVEALLSRIANLSYQGVQLASGGARFGADVEVGAISDDAEARPDGTADTGTADGGADAGTQPDARLNAGAPGDDKEIASLSEPVLRLEIALADGTSVSRTVFSDGDGGYLLRSDSAPQLYELSEYDLDGLLGLKPEQLIANNEDGPADASQEGISAQTISADTAGDVGSETGSEAIPSNEIVAGQAGEPETEVSPAAMAKPASEAPASTALPLGPSAVPSADPTAAQPAALPASPLPKPSTEIESTTGKISGDDAVSAALAEDGTQSTPADDERNGDTEAAASKASVESGASPSESAASGPTAADTATASEKPGGPATATSPDTANAPAAEQPDFRPDEPRTRRPAPPQWPYQPYPPAGRQPWPPQGPPQGAPPQSAPGWR